jgi:hypothetical protein
VPPVKAAISVDPATGVSAPVWAAATVRVTAAARTPARSAAGASAPVWATVTAPLGVRGCPLRRRSGCIRRRCCFYFCPYCWQFCHRQSCRCHCSLCRRSLAFLCRGNLGLLSMLHARGDRALRLSFGHAAPVEGCCVGKRLPQTSCCSSVQERRDEQRQPMFLLSAENRGRRGKEMSRRCLGCRIERL